MKTPPRSASRTAFAAILLAAVAVLCFAGSAHAASATWTNTSGGDWQTDSNWNPAAKPSVATDTASFTNGTYTVTSTTNMTGRPNVLTGQTVEFSFGSFTLSADSASGGAAIIHGGSLTLSSGIFSGGTNAGAYQSVGFDSSNSSLLITGTNSTWNLQIAGSRLGRANTAGGSANNNTVTVAAGAKFNDTSTGVFVIGQGTATNATSDNNSFTVTGAGSTANLAGSPTIGVMSTDVALVANNKLVVDNGGNMTVTRNLAIGSRSGGTSTAFSNNLVVVGGTGTGSVLTVNGTSGVSIATSGVGTGSGVQVKSGGTINVTNGPTTLVAGATNTHLSVDGGTYNASGRAITLGGSGTSMTISNGSVTAGSLTNDSGGVLSVGNGGTLNVSAASTNAGSVTIGSGSTATFTNGLGSSGSLMVDGSITGATTIATNGVLSGSGTAASTVTVNGTFAPGAASTNGTFTVTSVLNVPGTAQFRVFGNNINDKVIVSGGASLNGIVAVSVATNYTPASGDTFDLVDGTISNTPTLSLPALGGGLTWVTNDFLSSGTLAITNGGATPYNAWVAYWQTNSSGFTNTAGTDNPDGDPFDNNLEFAFDGNPTIGTGALLTAVKDGTNAVFNYVALTNTNAVTYVVQFTTDLTAGWTNASVTISNSANTNGINIPADYVRKEFVVPATAAEFYRVKATIAP